MATARVELLYVDRSDPYSPTYRVYRVWSDTWDKPRDYRAKSASALYRMLRSKGFRIEAKDGARNNPIPSAAKWGIGLGLAAAAGLALYLATKPADAATLPPGPGPYQFIFTDSSIIAMPAATAAAFAQAVLDGITLAVMTQSGSPLTVTSATAVAGMLTIVAKCNVSMPLPPASAVAAAMTCVSEKLPLVFA